MIAVADAIKEDSARAIRMLHDMGIETVMVTGDNEKTAKTIAKRQALTASLRASFLLVRKKSSASCRNAAGLPW